MKTYMVKRAFWKISPKKTKSPRFQEGKKKSFEIATKYFEAIKTGFEIATKYFEAIKTGFEIAEICGGFGQTPSFLLLKHVYEGRANPNPLTPKEDDRTARHLKYYIYWVPVTFGHCEVPRCL
jgi:hypothetical protein